MAAFSGAGGLCIPVTVGVATSQPEYCAVCVLAVCIALRCSEVQHCGGSRSGSHTVRSRT